MGKIDSIGAWNAHAALHSALEDADPEDKVLIVLIKPKNYEAGNTYRTRFVANMKNQELYYEAGVIQEQVMRLFREGENEELG